MLAGSPPRQFSPILSEINLATGLRVAFNTLASVTIFFIFIIISCFSVLISRCDILQLTCVSQVAVDGIFKKKYH